MKAADAVCGLLVKPELSAQVVIWGNHGHRPQEIQLPLLCSGHINSRSSSVFFNAASENRPYTRALCVCHKGEMGRWCARGMARFHLRLMESFLFRDPLYSSHSCILGASLLFVSLLTTTGRSQLNEFGFSFLFFGHFPFGIKAKNDHKSQSTCKAAGKNGAEGCTAHVCHCVQPALSNLNGKAHKSWLGLLYM